MLEWLVTSILFSSCILFLDWQLEKEKIWISHCHLLAHFNSSKHLVRCEFCRGRASTWTWQRSFSGAVSASFLHLPSWPWQSQLFHFEMCLQVSKHMSTILGIAQCFYYYYYCYWGSNRAREEEGWASLSACLSL